MRGMKRAMSGQRTSFWGRWLKRAKERFIIGVIMLTAMLAVDALFPKHFDQIMVWVIRGFEVAAVICGIYVLWLGWQLFRTRHERRADEAERQRNAEQWKERISSLTTAAERTNSEVGLERLCYLEDDEVLADLIAELESMPRGHRSLDKAYKAALRKHDLSPMPAREGGSH